ncbi:MAG: hypothetical protein M3356_02965, partial [Actinomycetota bacterium]|nr:hypothetical protein [Actinomycetota bacterium]
MQFGPLQGFVQGRIGSSERVFPRVVKRLLVTSALVCALALAVVAAPALSSRPYRPEPVQF